MRHRLCESGEVGDAIIYDNDCPVKSARDAAGQGLRFTTSLISIFRVEPVFIYLNSVLA